ncbi:MAG TPA: ABC transporter permease, partial [Clostridia bacterium]|nr:ABC transporter permease [Clostridia bacterium]
MKAWKFIGLRLITWALVIFIGVTFVFFIPRMFPSDPVENMISRMTALSGSMDAIQVEALRRQLRVQFGLEGTLWEQYTTYLREGLFGFNFGPSL